MTFFAVPLAIVGSLLAAAILCLLYGLYVLFRGVKR